MSRSWSELVAHPAAWECDFRLRRHDGSYRWVRAHAEPIVEGGSIVGFCASGMDIDEEFRTAEHNRLVARATNDVLWDWNVQTGRLEWNEAVQRFGWTREQLGSTLEGWSALVHPEDLGRVVAGLDAAIAERREGWSDEYRLRRRDGSYARVLDRGFIAFDRAGRPRRFVGTLLDVTEQRAEEERLKSVLDNLAEGLIVVGADGKSLHWNRAALEMHGFTGDETELGAIPAGPELLELRSLSGEPIPLDQWPIPRMLRGESLRDEGAIVLRRKDPGWSRVFRFSGTMVAGVAGGPPMGLLSIRDVTDRERAQQRLREQKEEADAERARLRAVLDVLPVGVFLSDPDGQLIGSNAAAARIWGRAAPTAVPAADELRARSGRWADSKRPVRPDEWPLARAITRRETAGPLEVEIEARDGERRTILIYAAPVVDSQGRNAGAVAVNVDISERKRAEEDLAQTSQLLRMLSDTTPNPLFAMDRGGRMIFANPAMLRAIGRPAEGVLGHTTAQWAREPEEGRRLQGNDRQVFETGETLVVEEELTGLQGRRVYLSTKSPLRDEKGTVIGLVGLSRDITDRKKVERDLQSANEQLELANRRKNEFLAMLSHELRNPLAPIRNSVHVLGRAAPGSDVARRAREIIDRQAQHMTRLIDDLLDVTRISRGKITLRRERVDLGALIRRTVEDHRDSFARHGVRLEVQLPGGDRPLSVDADPTRLAQVIGNLLNNSVKFTARGGETVLAVQRSDDGLAVVRVRDDGAGIAPETLRELFQPFVQADRTLDRSRGGLGLGLSLVKGLVEMHGGSVTAHSPGVGKGAEFVVALPLLPDLDEAPSIGYEHRRGAAGRKVLIIEDHADAAESLREVLELAGHEVAVATTGPRAFARRGDSSRSSCSATSASRTWTATAWRARCAPNRGLVPRRSSR